MKTIENHIYSLKLSPRLTNALIKHGIEYLEDLKLSDIMTIRGIGRLGREELLTFLHARGL